ncbi:MAG: hypothetical protein H0U38_03490 [Chloroflexia bacterium]|jgi:hypothetical protein|nr:hypothetical protein [Chloroflexia bacterium]
MTDDSNTYGFLFGADMEPGKIRRNPLTSESRFVSIGSISPTSVTEVGLLLPEVDEIWGLVVTLPRADSTLNYPRTSVTLRSGTVVQAALLTDTASFGTVEDIVAEAYYWELPRAWREALEGKADT